MRLVYIRDADRDLKCLDHFSNGSEQSEITRPSTLSFAAGVDADFLSLKRVLSPDLNCWSILLIFLQTSTPRSRWILSLMHFFRRFFHRGPEFGRPALVQEDQVERFELYMRLSSPSVNVRFFGVVVLNVGRVSTAADTSRLHTEDTSWSNSSTEEYDLPSSGDRRGPTLAMYSGIKLL